MKTLDPIIESALGCASRLGRAIVFLDRAAWMLEEAQRTVALAPDLEVLHTTLDILRGGTARAAHDLAAIVCGEEPYPGQAAAVPAPVFDPKKKHRACGCPVDRPCLCPSKDAEGW
jgi:hypothetical protein